MSWPWGKKLPWSREVAEAKSEAVRAREEHAYSVKQRLESERERHEAVDVANVLWDELRRNGWTEMLQQAWGGRPQ